VLGLSRSGTSWLAKIFDSHPDVLLRNEPNGRALARSGTALPAQICLWLLQRDFRSAAKRPHFAKNPGAYPRRRWSGRRLFSCCRFAVAWRWPNPCTPHLIASIHPRRVRAAIKLVNWDGRLAARTLPEARIAFLLRRPCGQIASVLAGLAHGTLDQSSGVPNGTLDLADAKAYAVRR